MRPRRNFLDYKKNASRFGMLAFFLIFSISIFSGVKISLGASSEGQMQIGNSTPTVSAVSLNNGSAITLTANATTTVRVNLTVTDNNGCGEVFFGGYVTTTVLRSGIGEGCTFSYENCYIATTTASSFTHSCPSLTSTQTSANATATFDIYYFAQATDASSSFPSNTWFASVRAEDASSSAHTASSTGIELNTLLAIDVSTSTNYGALDIGQNTGATNQEVQVRNAGNASSSLNVNGTAMCNGGSCLATSSQHYATSTFTYGGVEQTLQETATLVSGFLAPPQPLGPSWTNTTAFPSGINVHASAIHNNYLYVFAGNDGSSDTSTVRFAPINATGSIGAWTNTTALQSTLSEHTAFALNGYAYVIGGYGSASGVTSTVRFAPINATGSIGAWTNTTALPSGVYSHASVVGNGYLYVLGGYSTSTGTSTVRFAPINATGSIGAWTNTTALPNNLYQHTAVTRNGYLYAISGNDGTEATSTVRFAPINATGSIGAWQNTTALPSGFTRHTSIVNGNNVYVMGGFSSNFTSTVRFAPINTTGSIGAWQNTTPLSAAINAHTVVASDKYVYSLGGFVSLNATSTVIFNRLPSQSTYWGLSAVGGSVAGSYTATNVFTAIFSP